MHSIFIVPGWKLTMQEGDEPEFQDIKKAIMPYALMSHRAADLDLIASEREQA